NRKNVKFFAAISMTDSQLAVCLALTQSVKMLFVERHLPSLGVKNPRRLARELERQGLVRRFPVGVRGGGGGRAAPRVGAPGDEVDLAEVMRVSNERWRRSKVAALVVVAGTEKLQRLAGGSVAPSHVADWSHDLLLASVFVGHPQRALWRKPEVAKVAASVQ